jgi:endo-1,4-beta-xylanase
MWISPFQPLTPRLGVMLLELFMVITLFAGESIADAVAEGSALLPVNAVDDFQYGGSKAENGRLEHIAVTGQSFDRAMRLATNNDPGIEWGVQATLATDFDIEKGDVVLARFWLRCADSMTGQGFTGFVFEQNTAPNEKAAELRVGAGTEWLQCFVPFKATRDFPKGKAQICFRGGFDRQTVEIGGLELIDYGPGGDIDALPRTHVTYAGREADAPWRKAALERIEKIRKAPLTVHVVDAAGQPVKGASVHVAMTRHAFGFGSCVTVDQITGTSPDDAKSREIIEKHFNRVVFENDMKWPAMWDGVPARLDESVAWLAKRNIQIRGHNLQWPSWQWSPKQLKAFENNPAELRRLCEERVTSAVSHFRGKLVDWDVVNEPYNNVDLLKILGREVMIDWFKRAKAADPSCRMFLNDFGIFDGGVASEHRKHFYDTIKFLKDGGAPIDGIGIQSHFGAVMPPPAQLITVLDQFAQFGLPIESTEVSINNEDRELQADYLRDYMTAVFSHPKVDGIMLWGFWEGRHWRPNGALWTKNWTIRPVGKAWLDLVTKEWKTDTTIASDTSGNAGVRAFLGEYAIEVRAGGKTKTAMATLSKDGTTVTVTLD